ncbi:MAG: HYR domain-containing protein, partial [Flavobacteriales bacterium]
NTLDLFLGRVSDIGPSLWPNPSNFELPAAYCQGSGPLDLNALLATLHGGTAVAIVSNTGVSNLAAALGTPDGNGTVFNSNGSSIGVDLGELLAAGGTVRLVWRKATTASGTAIPKIEVSPNGTTWTLVPTPLTTASISFIGGNFTLPIAARYVRVQKDHSLSTTSFLVDALQYKAGTLLGGVWSGPGVTGSTLNPTGLTGPRSITYTVRCYSTTKVLHVDAAPVGGTLSGGGSACLGTEMELLLTGHSGATIIWGISTNGGTIWVNDTTNQAQHTVTATSTVTRIRALLPSDHCGSAFSNTIQVMAADITAPVLSGCPGNITAYASATSSVTAVNYTMPTATDNCSGTVSIAPQDPAHASGSQFPLGSTAVTIRASDPFGNSSTCTFSINVVDTIKPTITCPDPVTVATSAGCSAINPVLGTPVASDNCGPVTVTNNAPPTFPLGITNVVWSAKDASGNIRTCIQKVTVKDYTPPSITCPPDRNATANSGCATSMVALGTPVAADNCGIASVNNNATSSYTVGITTVTWTVMDNAGNTNTCTQHVTVTDISPPTLSCPPPVQVATNNGCTATGVNLGNPVAADNCDMISLTNDAPNAFSLGTTTVTWTASDISGNTATCTQIVTVTDETGPIALCREITVNVDNTGWAHVTAAMVNDGSSDNCTLASMSVSPQDFNSVGDYEVTLTVTDAAGNSAVCSTIVHVVDNSPPTAICTAITVYLDASGESSILSEVLDGGSIDNDSIVGFSASQTEFTCADLGTVADTLTVTDNSGNNSFCIAQVTVLDTVAPVVLCQATDVYLDASGQATIAASALDYGSSDACGPLSFTASQSNFTCADIGTMNVVLTATDANGNSATCTAQLTVHDTLAPEAECQAVTAYLDADGYAQITPTDLDAGSTDNCSISTRVVVPSTLQGAGDHSVQLIITDGSGNSDSCMAVVTVLDTISPVALCHDTLLQLGTSGTAILNAIDLDGGSTDNDAITSWSASQLVFGCADVGLNTDTLFVTDASGNTSFCVSTVTIVDPFTANAGTDGIAELCAGGASASLFPYLGSDAQAGGSWWFQGQAILTDFDPALDAPGDYLYTAANTSGCQVDSAVVHVVVHPNGNPGQDTSIAVCSNDTAFALINFLPGADAGGTWSNGSGSFNPAIDASGILHYTVNGLASCPAITASISIQVNTAPFAGTAASLALCVDAPPASLFAALQGGPDAGGEWTDPFGQNITGLVEPATMGAGSYTYTVTGMAPCTQASSTVVVSMIPEPSAAWSEPDPVCATGSPLDLSALITGVPDGMWSGPG